MIYIMKQEGLYQNKVNSSLVFTCSCKMGYWCWLVENIWGLVQCSQYRLISRPDV